MRKVKNAKDLSTNELIYFKGHAKATYMSDGTTVEDAINNIEVGPGTDLSDYATKEELNSKQDTIIDLEVIRQGAAKGATALQSYTEQYKGTVTGVKVNGSTKNPSNGIVDLGTVITSHQDISGKQDKLVSGTNIKTINGESILGEGDIIISGSTSGETDANVMAIETSDLQIDDISINRQIINTTDTDITLINNNYYKKTDVSSNITINLEPVENNTVTNYCIEFTTSSSGTAVELPSTIKWLNGTAPVFENNCTYQISIVNNLGVCAKFA